MKATKYFFLMLVLPVMLVNKTSYASKEEPSSVTINSINEDDAQMHSSDDSLDDNLKERENLENYIEKIKNSKDYIDSSEEIKILYDNVIEFNSRALDKNDLDWISYSNTNIKKDIEIIEKLANEDYLDKENINQNSTFFNNPSYKIAYLKLDDEKREVLDSYKKDGDDKEALSISALSDSDEMHALVLYSDWMYPFMDDEDSDGLIAESKILIDALDEDKGLIETFKNTKFEERDELIRDIINNREDDANELDINNNLENTDETNTIDEDQNDDGSLIENLNDSVYDQDSDTSQNPDSEELDSDKISKYKYQSMFYIKNRTRKYYEDLSDEQRDELDSMNTDNDGVLSIEELEASPYYTLPITNGIDWLYPFMYDKNEDGVINESDRNKIFSSNETDSNEPQTISTNDKEFSGKDNNQTKPYNSIFYITEKTRAAYENLPDDKKQILDQINTDGKYPLTLEEVEASGLFQIPVKSSDWIYPFMIDKNGNGEVGESYDYFKNSEYTQSSNLSTKSVDNSVYASSYHPLTYTYPTSSSNNRISHTNVKTGIKGLGSIVIILIIASIGYYLSKKNDKENNKLR